MAALIFRRPMNGQGALPYADWLEDFAEPIVLFTSGRDDDEHRFAHVERFGSFDDNGLTEIRAIELAERFDFTRIFAQSEHDILRAAQLREWLGVPGQSYDSALAYRDKVTMKTLARAGGVDTSDFAPLHTPLDLYRFVGEHDFPCVVKPRTGAGARGIQVLRSMADLKRFLERPLPHRSMVEAFVDGAIFHVDGLTENGRVIFCSPSLYVLSCLSFQDGLSTGSVLLDPSQALGRRLVDAAQKLIAALPPAPHIAFHAELFIDQDDRVLLCEVACRPGGSRTADPMEVAYGLNMYEQWVRRSFGLPVELPPPRPWFSVGRLMIPPRQGRLRSLPDQLPFDWIVDYRANSAPGQTWSDPDFCTAHVASFIFSGRDAAQAEARLWELDRWFRERIDWEDIPVRLQA